MSKDFICPRCGKYNDKDWPLNIDGEIVKGGCQAVKVQQF